MPLEDMPLPKSKDDFLNWLVPARNNIQTELLRLQRFLGKPAVAEPKSEDMLAYEILGLLLGTAFSLWRAVFQASRDLKDEVTVKAGKEFLDALIRNNMAVYTTELNAWSLGYYINNARFRLVLANQKMLPHPNPELDTRAGVLQRRINENKNTSGPGEWDECFRVFSLLLNLFEEREFPDMTTYTTRST